MTIEALQFLNTKEGRNLIAEYQDIRLDDLPKLILTLRKKEIPYTSELVDLLIGRKKAKDKFSKSEKMFFTPDGLEQSSAESISEYIAQRFKRILNRNATVIDLTCGVGGNTIFLAKYFKVLAVDSNPVHIYCAKHNAKLYGVENNIEFIVGNAEDNIRDCQAFFIDPQRIREGKTKTRSLYNSQPDITKLLPKMEKVTKNICLKISPAFNYAEVEELFDDPAVELISENNINKSALLWFGEFDDFQRRATILNADNDVISYQNQDDQNEPEVSDQVKAYVYLPNKAIVKAGLIKELAKKFNLFELDQNSEILTSDNIVRYPGQVFRSFKVITQAKYSIKNTKKILKEYSIDRAHIIAKNFNINPEILRKKLKLKEGIDLTLIFTTLKSTQHRVILAEKCNSK